MISKYVQDNKFVERAGVKRSVFVIIINRMLGKVLCLGVVSNSTKGENWRRNYLDFEREMVKN